MPVKSVEPTAGWDAIRGALADVRACHGEFETFFGEVFNELESLSSQLVQRRDHWQSESRQAEEGLRRQTEDIEGRRTALTTEQEEFRQAVEQHHNKLKQRHEEGSAEGEKQLRLMFEEIQRQREEMQAAQQAAAQQAERLEAAVAALADAEDRMRQDSGAAVANVDAVNSATEEQLGQMLQEVQQQRAELHGVQEASQAQLEKLADLMTELAEHRNDPTPGVTSGNDETLDRILEETRQQREQMLGAQEAAQAQTEHLAALAAELGNVCNELADARGEIKRSNEQLATQQAEAPDQQSDDVALRAQERAQELESRLQEMQQQHGQVEQERRLLESELETVRNRAVEMAESLDDQKRQAAQQQGQWTDELKRMRRLLEDMSVRTVRDEPVAAVQQQPTPPLQPVPQQSPPQQAAPQQMSDPALDSVMAQFEMLQRDLARRRAGDAKR